MVVLP